MATGTLAPVPFQTVFDANGNPVSGAKIYTYTAGTTTPATTYTDVNLSVANANPIVADSAGRFVAFLSTGSSYKFDFKTSADVEIRTVDNILAVPGTSNPTSDNGVCELRLTLTAGTPVTTADVTAATSVAVEPFRGNRIALYDGSTWNLRTVTSASISVPASTSQMYDVFSYDNSSTPAFETLAWTNDTTRATALTTQDGVLVKSGAATRRYIGSFRTTTVSGQTEDSRAKRYVWNYYNRVPRPLRVLDTTDSWTYTIATFRQANGSTANQLDVVVGYAEVELTAEVRGEASNSGAGASAAFGVAIGEDSTTTPHADCIRNLPHNPAANTRVALGSSLRVYPAVGRHFYAWLEYSVAAGTTTWSGDLAGSEQSGMIGSIQG